MIFDNSAQKEEQERIIEKWSWLTEGIGDDYAVANTSRILENAEYLMVAKGELASQWISEATNSASIGDAGLYAGGTKIPKVIFPIIRRVFPNLIANKLVSTQALSQPSGLIFYLTYKFDTNKGAIKAGDEYSAFPYADNNYLYQADKQGFAAMYSKNKIGPIQGTAAEFAAGISFSGGGYVTPSEVSGVELFNLETNRGVDATAYTITYGTNTAGNVDTVTIAALPALGTGAEYRFYLKYNQESTTKIPQMSFSMASTTINTDSRKMRANWTKEGEQDWKAWHSIDVEQELVKIISQEMAYETDREVLAYVQDQVLPGMKFIHDFANDSANGTVGNFLDRHLALTQKVLQICALVHQYNRLGPANWAVVSPQIATVFETLKGFRGMDAFGAGNGTLGVTHFGTYKNKLDIYVDPNRATDDVLIGYKSNVTPYGGGVVYAPYTNWMSPVENHDPITFDPTRGFLTRYGMTTVPRGRFNYASINIENITQRGIFAQ